MFDWQTINVIGVYAMTLFVFVGFVMVLAIILRHVNEDRIPPSDEDDPLPFSYSATVRKELERLNEEMSQYTGQQAVNEQIVEELERNEAKYASQRRLRYVRAKVLNNGWLAGDASWYKGEPIEEGVTRNPHPKGSEESRQWVRGFCQGYSKGSIVDPQPWMRKA